MIMTKRTLNEIKNGSKRINTGANKMTAIIDTWKTASGFKIIKYANGWYECNGTIYPHHAALVLAIGSTHTN
jgi:hypothetical protein